jgi:hypothetical protein
MIELVFMNGPSNVMLCSIACDTKLIGSFLLDEYSRELSSVWARNLAVLGNIPE